MNNFLKHVPGFRSNTRRNMIIAIFYYAICVYMIPQNGFASAIISFALPFIFFFIKDIIKAKKQAKLNLNIDPNIAVEPEITKKLYEPINFSKKTIAITLVCIIILLGVGTASGITARAAQAKTVIVQQQANRAKELQDTKNLEAKQAQDVLDAQNAQATAAQDKINAAADAAKAKIAADAQAKVDAKAAADKKIADAKALQDQNDAANQAKADADAKADQNIEQTVYTTNTGHKYHRVGCRYLRQSEIPITKFEAINEGLTPCSICNP